MKMSVNPGIFYIIIKMKCLKLFFLLEICTLHFLVYSQPETFDYLLESPNNEIIKDVYEADDGRIYICGYISQPGHFYSKTRALVFCLDSEGNFIDSVIYDISDRRYCLSNILTDSCGSLILAGYSTDTIPQILNSYSNFNIEFKKVNNNLELQKNVSYSIPNDYNFYAWVAKEGLSKEILISGGIVDQYTPILFMYVFNEAFDSIKAKFYPDTNRMCGAINQLNDTTYWIADYSKSTYYTLDYELNITDYHNARPHNINEPFGIKWDTDTSFYLAGEWNGGPDDDIGFFKQFHPIDSTGNIFNTWGTTDTLDIPAADALDYNNKDSIFIGGTTNFWFYYHPSPSWYFIIQTDSNLNVRWERFYGGEAHYVMWKIIATNDGGCIVAGNRYDYENVSVEETDIHILKLNSQGLLVKTPDQPAIEMHEALVFPNPGTDRIKVRIALQYRQSTFEMFDIHGRMVLSEQINGKWGEVNTANLSTGTYVYSIFSQDGLFESGKWIKR